MLCGSSGTPHMGWISAESCPFLQGVRHCRCVENSVSLLRFAPSRNTSHIGINPIEVTPHTPPYMYSCTYSLLAHSPPQKPFTNLHSPIVAPLKTCSHQRIYNPLPPYGESRVDTVVCSPHNEKYINQVPHRRNQGTCCTTPESPRSPTPPRNTCRWT